MYNFKHVPHQLPNEETIVVLRRHWFELFKILFYSLIVLVLPFLFYYVSPDISLKNSSSGFAVFVVMMSSFYLAWWVIFYFAFLDYYLDTWVVTNERIISIEQNSLFARTISENRLEMIQDVTSEVNGLWKTLLNYGTVYVQTAGEVQRFAFEDVAHPDQVVKLILHYAEISKNHISNIDKKV